MIFVCTFRRGQVCIRFSTGLLVTSMFHQCTRFDHFLICTKFIRVSNGRVFGVSQCALKCFAIIFTLAADIF